MADLAEPQDSDKPAAVRGRARLFISYARADRERVRPLAAALEAAGHRLWWDALIDGGAAFAKVIEQELDSADAVIVVWSAQSIHSDWVRDEAAHARDRKRLVAITLDRAEPPLGFRQYHAIGFEQWQGRTDSAEFSSLERSIMALGPASARALAPGGGANDTPGPTGSAPERRGLRRRTLLVGGVATLGAAAGGGLWLLRSRGSVERNGVAVLPFTNLSGDKGQDYFAQGLSEEVRGSLVRNPGLRVAAPVSSNEFKNHTDDAMTIGRQLKVDFLLDGSVRKSGSLVRIDATLTDAASGFASWSQSFDRQLDDIFAVQREIADTVAKALLAQVTSSRGTAGETRSIEAYDAFLRGKALFNADSGEASDRAALAQFDRALTLDPKFAAAHAARSRSLAGIAVLYSTSDQIVPTYDAAVAAAKAAVDLAPDLAAGQLALGFATLSGLLDFRKARPAYERAYALGEGDADVLLMYAFFAAKSGRDAEALQVVRRAEQLDPLNPRTVRGEGSILLASHQYAPSIEASARALAMAADLSGAHGNIGVAHHMMGQTEAAREAFAAEPTKSIRLAGLAMVERRANHAAAAQAAWAQLLADYGDSAAYQQAQVLAQWGQIDAAVTALEKAYAVRDGGITGILGDPLLAPLAKAPGFTRLLLRMGLA
ncbi:MULTISPECIES: TIR domain-containing protein [Novosphingobium]|uniref:TIR domain-containing protein n=1 Tax=Novosphingobium aerophilum TaxID=2839843 RepID=A0A7X1F9X3_9SPHN|nr:MULTISPECIES: TIR domain-containing protein [Novosphingobium]MBC2653110.1 TIR domain-containing protein [Novosphingobium aerophilum]